MVSAAMDAFGTEITPNGTGSGEISMSPISFRHQTYEPKRKHVIGFVFRVGCSVTGPQSPQNNGSTELPQNTKTPFLVGLKLLRR